MITFIGLALGPYTIGRLSVALGNDLREAMLWGLLVNPVAALLLWRAQCSPQRCTEDHRGFLVSVPLCASVVIFLTNAVVE